MQVLFSFNILWLSLSYLANIQVHVLSNLREESLLDFRELIAKRVDGEVEICNYLSTLFTNQLRSAIGCVQLGLLHSLDLSILLLNNLIFFDDFCLQLRPEWRALPHLVARAKRWILIQRRRRCMLIFGPLLCDLVSHQLLGLKTAIVLLFEHAHLFIVMLLEETELVL